MCGYKGENDFLQMKKINKQLKFLKNKYFWIFVGIFVMGAFLRAYNFAPWLHFELDQARDATLVREALNGGAGELPLLGPRAAGTFLRLGPAFYYIEYIFASIFQDAVVGSAMAILFFAILSIPISYLFFREYFSKKNTLAILLIYTTSLFLVVYARFSWNPNMLPFFVTFFLLALLKSVDKGKQGKKKTKKKLRTLKRKRGIWLLVASFTYGLLAQFHFLAMIILAIAGIIFLAIKRPKIKKQFWVGAVVIILFLHIPVFVNEAKTGGSNAQLFLKAVIGKSDSKKSYTIVEKAYKDYSESALKYWTMTTGSQLAELPKFKIKKGTADIQCDKYCRENLFKGILALTFFSLGITLLVLEVFLEKDIRKKNFLILNLIILAISSGVFLPLAFDMSPRFFLIVTPLPFIFLGLIFRRLGKIIGNKNFIWSLAVIIMSFNLYFVINYFNQLKNAKVKPIKIGLDRIMKQKTRITLEQEIAIADYMEKFYRQNKYPVFFHGQSEFHRSFSYLLDGRKIPRDGIGKGDNATICRQGNYFLIVRTQSDLDNFKNYLKKFIIIEKKLFGTLTVFHLRPKPAIINCEIPNQKTFRNYKGEGGAVARRYKWKEIFKMANVNLEK